MLAIDALAQPSIVQAAPATGQTPPIGQGPATAPDAPAVLPEVVVTGSRRPKSLEGAQALDELSEGRISTYGAGSINEVIERLQQQQGGREFSIIVNGRRIGSLADLGELPAEALKGIEIYTPADAKRFGFSADKRLLNLTLKRDFRSLSLEDEVRAATEGAGTVVQGELRGVVLNGDRRLNGFARAQADEGLLARQRPGAANGDQPVPPGQSLLPRRQSYYATLGAGRPLGAGNLDLGLRGARTQNLRQTNGTTQQESLGGSSSINASYNNTVAGFQVTAIADVGRSDSRSRILAGDAAAGCTQCRLAQDLRTATINAGLTARAGGTVATLPAGEMRIDLSAQRNRARTTATDRLNDTVLRTGYATTSAQANVSLPIVAGSTPVLGFLGTVELMPSIDYNAIDGRGHVIGTNVSLSWRPSSALFVNASISRRGSLPSNEQINAPVQTLIGFTVYDYRAGALVPIEQITGGAPLAPQASLGINVSANYDRTIGKVQLNGNLGFSRDAVERPTVSLTEPSAFAERYFPDRFRRDAAGRLVSVDVRPFNAVRQVEESVTTALNLSGGGRGESTLNWNIGIQGQRQLRRSLRLGPDIPVIDTLTNPLSISTGVQGRQRWSGQLGLRTRRFGGNVSVSRSGGIRSTSVADPTNGVDVAPLVRVDGNLLMTLQSPGAAGGGGGRGGRWGGYRLELSIRNLTNARPRIRASARSTGRDRPSSIPGCSIRWAAPWRCRCAYRSAGEPTPDVPDPALPAVDHLR
ncbi:hypothetical protein [Sphingomonas rubra]|uniref:TonB-dependent receptor n=1 Tax=Sphingomonas rubra TaxID=634430 RepID=A0A1I5SA41_9SPHN|nr:hypothetical protein [Sphingomonas rubra]SFP67583.1 hypothetical protein SAMN04488241_10581 [Sphingomonas rubra]